ncbi:glycerophosphodiester phosphodiesterase [Salibacterium aidingense]|uniref:glycerophosphodiester phosphodiesterase n=1 Tax=Salibacterium aidingense TaxID=384933 RepID=UPI00041C3C4C|nr:glycerophosphodiester phosphodiesterase family protein [Salibacterium aidingense]
MAQCIAHRGWSGQAPENTLAAFERAWSSPIVDGIELDVHLSRDKVPIVIHDQTVDRTTNGHGLVKSYTVNELKELDAGSWYKSSFAGETIPTLEEVLREMDGSTSLTIELKQRRNIYPGLEEKVSHLLRKYDMAEKTLVGSFDHVAVQKIKQMDPALHTGLIVMSSPLLVLEQMLTADADHLMIYHEMLTQELVERIHNQGGRVNAWTVDKTAAVQRLYELSPELLITSNHPDIVWEAVEQGNNDKTDV